MHKEAITIMQLCTANSKAEKHIMSKLSETQDFDKIETIGQSLIMSCRVWRIMEQKICMVMENLNKYTKINISVKVFIEFYILQTKIYIFLLCPWNIHKSPLYINAERKL